MKKTLLIALVAFATVLAVSCKEKEAEPEDDTLKLPGTSWSFNLNTTLYGSNVLLNDTLNILDDKTYDRDFDISAGGFQKEMHASSGYTWDGTYLTLLDSVGNPPASSSPTAKATVSSSATPVTTPTWPRFLHCWESPR